MITSPQIYEFIKELGKTCFHLGETEFQTHLKALAKAMNIYINYFII